MVWIVPKPIARTSKWKSRRIAYYCSQSNRFQCFRIKNELKCLNWLVRYLSWMTLEECRFYCLNASNKMADQNTMINFQSFFFVHFIFITSTSSHLSTHLNRWYCFDCYTSCNMNANYLTFHFSNDFISAFNFKWVNWNVTAFNHEGVQYFLTNLS